MTSDPKPLPKLPPRMSAPKPEDAKPSRIVEGIWWLVFIIPMAFTYWATQSVVFVLVLLGIRIAMMVVPRFTKKKAAKKDEPPVPNEARVITKQSALTPYKEELKAEWYGLLKFLRIYDREKEDANLAAYRKLRGWD